MSKQNKGEYIVTKAKDIENEEFDRDSEDTNEYETSEDFKEMSLQEAREIMSKVPAELKNKNNLADLRLKPNRMSAPIVAAHNILKAAAENSFRKPGFNVDGSVDLRRSENRNNPDLIAKIAEEEKANQEESMQDKRKIRKTG